MPILTVFDEGLVEYGYEGITIIVEMTFNGLHIIHPKMEQYFSCKELDITSKAQMLEAFPNRTAILVASQLHTKGATNKAGFNKALESLVARGRITNQQKEDLKTFIMGATCPPMKVLEKLIMKGFEGMFDVKDFAEDAPEFIFCADILEKYISELE